MKLIKDLFGFYLRRVRRRFGFYTSQDMIDFADWYGNCVYYSEGNCGHAAFRFQDYENGIQSESFMD